MKTRSSASLARACVAVAGVLLVAATAQAHKLSPTGTVEERRLSDIRGSWLATLERSATGWGLKAFGDPVHEEITDRIYGCDGMLCNGDAPTRAPAAVLAGVRWNDDPPFRIGSGEGRGTSRLRKTFTRRFCRVALEDRRPSVAALRASA